RKHPSRRTIPAPLDFEDASEHQPEPALLPGRTRGLGLLCQVLLALFEARKFDEVLEESKAHVLEGRQPPQPTCGGGEVHTARATQARVRSARGPGRAASGATLSTSSRALSRLLILKTSAARSSDRPGR